MSDSPALDALVSVTPRFARSVALTRDAGRCDALDGYLLTPTGRDILRRLAAASRGESSTRAWSVTGPYGSGKSSLALLAAQLLAGDDRVRRHALDFLADADPALAAAFPAAAPRLLPVLVTGSRRPLDKALAAALAEALRGVAVRGRPPQVIDRLDRLAAQDAPAGTAVVGLFEEANAYLARPGGECAGLLLVVDELGKFLEFGAADPARGDVFVLQELAEAATRSARPFLVVTVLHQALDRYADHLSPGRRAEWAKVQGRFEDVAFEERGEQLLRLLAHAVRRDGPAADLAALGEAADEFAAEAVAVGVRAGAMPAAELGACLAACYPLHPLTSVVLGPLFRQLAQNERSLFAFLGSSEPFGFRDFLRAHTAAGGAYRLDDLYDYVVTALGPALFATHRGRQWSEVQTALDRLPDAGEVEVRLAKTVGLLQALGPAAGVPASAAVLKFALRGVAPDAAVDDALASLARRSVVVFRRHAGGYALWEGSDVEVEARLLAARAAVERDQGLAGFLTRQVPAQPRVARRHYSQTGTLRYYDAAYCDLADLQRDLFAGVLSGAGGADGRLLYCLPRDAGEREAMRDLLGSAAGDTPVLAALPHDVADLRERCHELLCLRWVAENTPELESDRTARRELDARLAVAERDLRAHLDALFSPANPGCAWLCRGHAVALATARQLNDRLSQACDDVYPATPRWRNELVNRRSLSSSAAAARRNLIEAMFERADADGLGFEGHPPERAMYETLLKGTRLHRKHGGTLGFHAPDAKAEPAVRAIWAAIQTFLDGTDAGRLPVERLFATLRRPPFGLKDGVLPVLLAAALAHAPSRVALYEDGSFVPKPNAAAFERLFRAPGKFELQRFHPRRPPRRGVPALRGDDSARGRRRRRPPHRRQADAAARQGLARVRRQDGVRRRRRPAGAQGGARGPAAGQVALRRPPRRVRVGPDRVVGPRRRRAPRRLLRPAAWGVRGVAGGLPEAARRRGPPDPRRLRRGRSSAPGPRRHRPPRARGARRGRGRQAQGVAAAGVRRQYRRRHVAGVDRDAARRQAAGPLGRRRPRQVRAARQGVGFRLFKLYPLTPTHSEC